MERTEPYLHYGRHFLLLLTLVIALAASGSARPPLGVAATFAAYGALYAATLAITMRARPTPRRAAALVVAGAALCAAWALVIQAFDAAPRWRLIGIAAVGAASFATTLRQGFRAALSLRAIPLITAGCTLATLAAFHSGAYRLAPGPVLAGAWWLAFSAGLWLCDRGRLRRESISM